VATLLYETQSCDRVIISQKQAASELIANKELHNNKRFHPSIANEQERGATGGDG
jgi:hypothetical protein